MKKDITNKKGLKGQVNHGTTKGMVRKSLNGITWAVPSSQDSRWYTVTEQ